MPSDGQQERLWYKTALVHVIMRLEQDDWDKYLEYLTDGEERIQQRVHEAVRQVIEHHHPVTTMDWWNLRDEFKQRAWEAVHGTTPNRI